MHRASAPALSTALSTVVSTFSVATIVMTVACGPVNRPAPTFVLSVVGTNDLHGHVMATPGGRGGIMGIQRAGRDQGGTAAAGGDGVPHWWDLSSSSTLDNVVGEA